MKTAALIIKPQSPFGTPLKGDTLFGQFCWQMAENPDLIHEGLDFWVKSYKEKPFIIFSSAFPLLAEEKPLFLCPRPATTEVFQEKDRKKRLETLKQAKKNKWMALPLNLEHDGIRFFTDEDAFLYFKATLSAENKHKLSLLPSSSKSLSSNHEQSHNTINRLSMTTGTGPFAPYSHVNTWYLPGLSLVIFIGFDEKALDCEKIQTAMEKMGAWGFGRDASTGLGRFEVLSCKKIPWREMKDGDACYTLGPCVPEEDAFEGYLGNPFVRFGRHGGELALSGKPYKNPIVMLDEGALLYPGKNIKMEKPYLGSGLDGLSKADPRTISQGYSLYLPLQGGKDA